MIPGQPVHKDQKATRGRPERRAFKGFRDLKGDTGLTGPKGNTGDAIDAVQTVKYNTATSSWPARPNTTRVVFWLALSDTVPDPSGAVAYDLVFKGAN